MAIARPTFKGTYDGKNIWTYKNKINYKIEDLEKRKELLYEILNIEKVGNYEFTNDLFWKEVWNTGVCKAELNKTDFLWSETNIAATLESMGTYLLALDSEENKINYKIYKKEKDFKDALSKEKNAINKDEGNLSLDEKRDFKIVIPK